MTGNRPPEGVPDHTITTDMLQDASVTSAKLAAGAVNSSNAVLSGAKSQPSRVLGTIYQNTTAKLLIVVASVALDTVAATDTAKVQGLNDTVTPPVVEDGEIESNLGAVGQTETLQIMLLVPAGNYYKLNPVVTGTGTATLVKWTEYTL